MNLNHHNLAALLLCCGAVAVQAEDKPVDPATNAKFYREQVAPILTKSCFGCHGPKSEVKGGLFLGSRQDILKGGESGPAGNLKKSDASLFVDAINHRTLEMPPKKKLPAEQIAVLTRWVELGVPIPPDAETKRPEVHEKKKVPEVNEETKNFWAFRPVANPAAPQVKNAAWVTNGIDNFILAKLEAAGLNPVKAADKAKLIRRAYYDLTGLPPSIADVEAFVKDDSDQAFEKVIDRLLNSPQYGERWGRHWLDLVRYAESNSYERDDTKPHIWRYRDYVIKSLNEDKPYTQFIKEQLAGDEFEPKTPDSIVATGYYRLGIWDDEPVSQKQALYDDLDDILLTTSQVFLGLTMNCARCHDHKIDPIPQRDYYRFLAFFSGFRRYGVRSHQTVEAASIGPIAVDGDVVKQAELRKQLDRELNDINRKINNINGRIQALLSPAEKEDFRAVAVRVDLARKYIGKGLSKQLVADYENAVARKKVIEETRPAEVANALIIKEIGPQARDTFVLIRGNANVEGEKVSPGFPSVLSPPEPIIKTPKSGESSGRRMALANWISDASNPLTARVMVNRLWQYHFGRGIVRSSNNFGSIGDRPTHPQLLDWLATQFMQRGWKLKTMHKLIMLSSTYRLSSVAEPTQLAKDPANNLLWRFDMRRLSSEELRDSILAANGSLNLKLGGPSFYPVIPPEVLAGQSRPGNGWGNSSVEERARRAVYIFIKRSLLEPMSADFDFADVDSTCPVRFVTTQPTQALGLLNSEFVNRQAGVFAEYLKKSAGDDPAKQVELALLNITQRRPSQADIDRGVALIDSLKKDGVPSEIAVKYFCLVSYNLNEFLYLD
ncbi:MAG: PSD1 and planctomycete cytochrome C domain-containing protein [Planctomycetota bacterium]|nr:PSD1 and planctomycete cytochrome C domain-containing protein [Planctomycetota bacterium]